ncbi:MAG: lytic murein transglycosylase [Actinomycetota bacterium]
MRIRSDHQLTSRSLHGCTVALRFHTALLLCLSLILGVSTVASARPGRPDPDTQLSTAKAQADQAALDVASLTAQVQVAQRRYTAAVARVGLSNTDSLLAGQYEQHAAQAAQAAQDRTANAARALYASGGPLILVDHVMASRDVGDLATRLVGVRQILVSTGAVEDAAINVADLASVEAAELEATLRKAVVTADQIKLEAAKIDRLLARATARLDALSDQARRLSQAKAARTALALARSAARKTQRNATAGVRAQQPSADYFNLYRTAATTCPGMEWTLLAAVGQVESGHGRNVGPSSAGAIGPMQFMPATFGQYGVDGDGDGDKDAWDAADAIYSAANYLCASGAGSPRTIRDALFAYNRAQWYVDLVLGVQKQIVGARLG